MAHSVMYPTQDISFQPSTNEYDGQMQNDGSSFELYGIKQEPSEDTFSMNVQRGTPVADTNGDVGQNPVYVGVLEDNSVFYVEQNPSASARQHESSDCDGETKWLGAFIKKEKPEGQICGYTISRESFDSLPCSKDTLKSPEPLGQCGSVSEGNQHSCQVGDKTVGSVNDLKEHRISVHTDTNHCSCSLCTIATNRSSKLFPHVSNRGSEPYRCSLCEKSFDKLCALKDHLKLHTVRRRYSCTVCDITFTYASNLKQHMKVHTAKTKVKSRSKPHTDDKIHHCSICNKSFSNAATLKQHMLLHKDKKDHHCYVCEKSFTSASSLEEHIRVHSVKKTYCCMYCDKSYTWSSDLKRHICSSW